MLQSTGIADLEDDEDLHSDGDAGDAEMPSATMLRQMRCAAGTILFCPNSNWCLCTLREACCVSIGDIHHVSAGVTEHMVPL